MQPFALLHRDGADHVEVLTGDVITVDTLAEIPLEPGRPTLAVIPYRQIAERGFECVDDGAPLECLRITSTVGAWERCRSETKSASVRSSSIITVIGSSNQ